MKTKFVLAAVSVVMAASSVYSADVLTPTSLFKGDLGIVAFSKDGDDFIVDEVSGENSDDPTSYTIYDKNLNKVFSVIGELESLSYKSSKENILYGDCEFSQTLLNEDDNIEYIQYTIGEDGYCTGFRLMQSNGNHLADISFPEAVWSPGMYVVKVGDRVFLSVGESQIGTTVYEVNRKAQANVLTLVSENADAVGFPNPVSQGEVFTIEGLNGSNGSTVVVNRSDGSLVKAFEIREEPVIPTDDLSVGTYIYTVTRNGKLLTSGKLIVK